MGKSTQFLDLSTASISVILDETQFKTALF